MSNLSLVKPQFPPVQPQVSLVKPHMSWWMAVWDYTTQYIVDDYGTMLPNIFLYRNHHPWDSGSQGRAAEPEVDDAEKEVKTIAKTGKQAAQNSRLPKFF